MVDVIAEEPEGVRRRRAIHLDDADALTGLRTRPAQIDNPDIGRAGRIAGNVQQIRRRAVVTKNGFGLEGAAAGKIAGDGECADGIAGGDDSTSGQCSWSYGAGALQQAAGDVHEATKRAVHRQSAGRYRGPSGGRGGVIENEPAAVHGERVGG